MLMESRKRKKSKRNKFFMSRENKEKVNEKKELNTLPCFMVQPGFNPRNSKNLKCPDLGCNILYLKQFFDILMN